MIALSRLARRPVKTIERGRSYGLSRVEWLAIDEALVSEVKRNTILAQGFEQYSPPDIEDKESDDAYELRCISRKLKAKAHREREAYFDALLHKVRRLGYCNDE